LCSSLFAKNAAAEKLLAKQDDWEIYTDGRAAAFASYVRGDGYPRVAVDANGNPLHDLKGGGLDVNAEREPKVGGAPGEQTQGTIENMRVRSGFVGNTIGLGVRQHYDESTLLTAYIQLWAFVESDARRKNFPNQADMRQGYAKVEARWGSFLAGRSRALFSRGATDIDVQYAHRYGVGYPGNVDLNGPTAGHIGFGVLGSGFAAGLVYATPLLAGLQVTVGLYDPVQIPAGAWSRTKWLRPEGELTFERPLGDFGKIALFANGAYQPLYHDGSRESTFAAGIGYGGRIELGPVHLGVAGHYGSGLGLNYALESSDANSDSENKLRKFDGYYVQGQVVLGPVDVSAGWGISRVFLNASDSVVDPTTMQIPHSVIKYQMGNSAGVVYHVKPWWHLDIDGFRAQFAWFLGEEQVIYALNSGMTFTW
jgi:hypothetical protein